jgi:hypothetical protein
LIRQCGVQFRSSGGRRQENRASHRESTCLPSPEIADVPGTPYVRRPGALITASSMRIGNRTEPPSRAAVSGGDAEQPWERGAPALWHAERHVARPRRAVGRAIVGVAVGRRRCPGAVGKAQIRRGICNVKAGSALPGASYGWFLRR